MKIFASVLTIAALILVLSVIAERAQAKGVCFTQLRFVSSRERIESAIHYSLQRFPPTVVVYKPDAVTFFKPARFTRYADVQSFLLKNPGCCTVGERGDDGWLPPFLDRAFGLTSAVVHLRYSFSYRDPAGDLRESTIDTYVPISSCGKAWEGS